MTRAFSPRSSQGAAPGLASLFRASSGDALLAMMLASGGDERIAQGADGRNPYGAPIRPTDREIWFASSTASAISRRGWEAAGAALPMAFSARSAEDWFGDLRQRLLAALAPPDSDLVFCASGTQAEYSALVCARALAENGISARPEKICNLLVAPSETGRGAPLAAAGRHFVGSAPFGSVLPGKPIEGWPEDDIFLETLAIRDAAGAPLVSEQIDAEGAFLARDYATRGVRVLLHVLDCSKTGLNGFSRGMAARLKAAYPDHVVVVVDACQLRCPPSQIRADLAAGFMVMISGSKFAGGPAFAGALLLPPEMMRRFARQAEIFWPEGLGAHAAALDWPPSLREKLAGPFGAYGNQGLGLRWEAALADYEAYLSLDPATSARAVALFGEEARKNIARRPGLTLDESTRAPTILPIVSQSPSGAFLPAAPILKAMRASGLHLGQGVAVGGVEVLRLCLAAPQIVDFALRLRDGADEAAAFAPLARDMEAVFEKWGALLTGE